VARLDATDDGVVAFVHFDQHSKSGKGVCESEAEACARLDQLRQRRLPAPLTDDQMAYVYDALVTTLESFDDASTIIVSGSHGDRLMSALRRTTSARLITRL